MKTLRNVVLGVILCLPILLFCYWMGGRKEPSTTSVAAARTPEAPVTVQMPVATPDPRVEIKPFRWSQLESPDYRTYVKNLRNIGCPEPTLRAIVTADMDAKYWRRGDDLEKKLGQISQGSWVVQLSSFDEAQALKAELQKLPEDESAEIAGLLGLRSVDESGLAAAVAVSQTPGNDNQAAALRTRPGAPAGDSTATVAVSGVSTGGDAADSTATVPTANQSAVPMLKSSLNGFLAQLPAAPKSASMPLVFQSIEQTKAGSSPSAVQAVNDLRQSFIDTVSSSGQNPSDPAYQQVWQQAQAQNDQMILPDLGYNAYMDYYVAQYQNSLGQ